MRVHKSLRLAAVLLAGSFVCGSTTALAEPLDHFATTDDIGINKVPHLGESHVLVVPHRSVTFPRRLLNEPRQVLAKIARHCQPDRVWRIG